MNDPRHQARHHLPTFFWLAVLALFIVHTMRAIGQYSPIYGGDEYAYLISGLYRDDLKALWSTDPMLQKITNPMYLWVIAHASKLFVDVSAVMRVFNAFVFSMTIAWCARWVFQRSGRGGAYGVLGLAGLLPSSAMTAAVMADITYYCFCVLVALSCCGGVNRHARRAAFCAGVMVAMAFLTKPHALAFAGASFVFFVLSPFVVGVSGGQSSAFRERIARGLYLGGWFLGAMYLTLLVASVVFYGKLLWNPRYPLGVFYAGIAGSMATSGVSEAIERPAELMRYFLANMGSVLSIAWPFLVVLTLGAIRERRCRNGGEIPKWSPGALVVWLALAISMATGMVAFFTFSISIGHELEGGRVHTRYYAFLYVVTIVGALAVRDWSGLLRMTMWSRGRLRIDGYWLLAITWAAVLFVSALLLRDMRVWFQDNVELFHLFRANWREYRPVTYQLMVAALASSFLFLVLKMRCIKGLYVTAMMVFFGSALWEVTGIQHIHSSVIHFRIETGQLLKSYLPDVPDDQILVVGEARYGQTAHVLYGLQRPVHVRQSALGQGVRPSMVPSGVRYIFSVENVPVRIPATVMFSSKAGTLYALQ